MQLNTLSDHILILRTGAGDVQAFEALYSRHSALVFSTALRITGRRRAAEEATQDAFLGLWRTARNYDATRGTLKAWLLSAVRNRSIDWLRREARHTRSIEISEAIVDGLEAADRTEEQAVRQEEARATRRLLDDLPAEQRQVIELAYFGELTQVEIAETVGIPLGTVKGRQRLALKRMHTQIHAGSVG